jgi:hypothetical protein
MSILPYTPRVQPASFSILQRTFLDILDVNEQDRDIIWNLFEKMSFASLGISSNKFAKLRHRGIYIEETLDYVLPLTIDYIHNIWNDSAEFHEVMDSIFCLIRKLLQKEVVLQTNTIFSDMEIYSNIRLQLLDGLIISPTVIPQKIVNELHKYRISKWTELSEISELKIINRFGCNFESISLLHCLWLLYPWAEMIIGKLLPIICGKQSYGSFESIIEKFILNKTISMREKEIVLRRQCWRNDGNAQSETLESIAEKVNLTRERIRQIVLKLSDKLNHPESIKRAFPLWVIIDSFIQELHGIISFSDLAQKLMLFFRWEEAPSGPAIKNLLTLCPKHFLTMDVSNEYENFIISDNFACNDCNSVCDYLLELISQDGEEDIVETTKSLNSFCKTKCPKEYKSYINFNPSFINYLLSRNDYLKKMIKIKGDKIYSYDKYKLYFGRLSSAVEYILMQSGRGMHFSEIYDEIKKYRPDDSSISVRSIQSIMEHYQTYILWDRGTFIHKKNAVFPYSVIRKAEEWATNNLNQQIPFVTVFGAFSDLKEECIEAGIISESALYSCFRISGNPSLAFPKYPRIYRSNDDIQKLPITMIMEDFIKDASGLVSYEEIKDFAVNTVHLKEIMLAQYLKFTPNVVRFERGMYIHTDYLRINEKELWGIINFTKKILSTEKHVSVKKVFDDKRVECKIAGIDNSVILYSLLQLYAEDEIVASRYPLLQVINKDTISRTGILKEITIYIRNQNTFITYQQLEDHFVKKLGYSAISVYRAASIEGIYKYLPGCLVHHDTIEWSNEKQQQVEDIASMVYNKASFAGNLYGLVSFVIEDDHLPILGNNLYWSETLMADLLSKTKSFNVIGNGQNAFIPIPNKDEIENVEDLLYLILKNQYNGAANLEDFTEDLRELGIIKKIITQGMLGISEKISIVNQEIMLTELIQNAQNT